MSEVQEGGGLRPALLPARLVQLAGAGRLPSVHAIMDSLRGTSAFSPEVVLQALTEHLPSVAASLDPADLVDHQNQDLPLAIFLLTHPALPRGAAPVLLLRTLAGWPMADVARLYGMTLERACSKLSAGLRRIRILGLAVAWPHPKELRWRVKHSIEMIEQLYATGQNRRSQRLGKTAVCDYATEFLESLALHPVTQSRWTLERWWRVRYAEPQPFLVQGGTTPFMRA